MIGEVDELKLRFEDLKSQIKSQKKYFHLNTVNNFIAHLSKIKNENAKEWISINLRDYIDDCKVFINSMDRDTSESLYLKYLTKIGDYYRVNLQFSIYASLDIVFIPFAFLIIISKVLFFNWVFSVFFGGICYLCYLLYLVRKKKNKRTFGLFH